MSPHPNPQESVPADMLPVAGVIRTHWTLAVCVVCGHEQPRGEHHARELPRVRRPAARLHALPQPARQRIDHDVRRRGPRTAHPSAHRHPAAHIHQPAANRARRTRPGHAARRRTSRQARPVAPPDRRRATNHPTATRPAMTNQLHSYLTMLAGPAPAGKLLELRHRTPSGMRQTFIPARRLDLAATAITSLGRETDLYIGVLLRTRRRGGRDAVHQSHLLFAEIDQPDGHDRLAGSRSRRPRHWRRARRAIATPTGRSGRRPTSSSSWRPTGGLLTRSAPTSPAPTPHACSAAPQLVDQTPATRAHSAAAHRPRPPLELREPIDGLPDPPSPTTAGTTGRTHPRETDPVDQRLLRSRPPSTSAASRA